MKPVTEIVHQPFHPRTVEFSARASTFLGASNQPNSRLMQSARLCYLIPRINQPTNRQTRRFSSWLPLPFPQLQQSPPIPVQLRALANSINLRFEDFTILEGGRAVVIGRRAFHAAIWANQTPVTLSLTADCNQGVSGDLKQSSGAASGALNPIAEFFDLVPSNYLPLMPSVQIRMVQGTLIFEGVLWKRNF